MKQLNASQLEISLRKLASAQGFDKSIIVRGIAEQECVHAGIDLSNNNIEITYPVEWNPLHYRNIARFSKSIKSVQRKELDDIIFHEIGHNRLRNDSEGLGCPEDLEHIEITMDAVSDVMQKKGIYSTNGMLYLENCISDIIDNLNCSCYSKLNGLSIFFAEQGELNGGKYSPLYEAFVKLNTELWGTKKQKKMLSKYYTNHEKVDSAVKRCIERRNLTKNKNRNIGILFNKDDWHDIYTVFAQELAELMDQDAPEILPGSGSGGKGYKVYTKPSDDIDDSIYKRIIDPDNLKKSIKKRMGSGKRAPSFIEQWQALDYAYQALASDIHIKAETMKKGMSFPVAPVGHRIFDSESDPVEDIIFGKILFDDKGEPCLAVPRGHIERTADYKIGMHKYPDLNIAVLDTSVSMADSSNERGTGGKNIIPWGDNSKYHYAVLTWYGVVKSLHSMGIAVGINYNLITFSEDTESSGMKGHENLTDIKKRILNPDFGGGTSLDLDILTKHVSSPGSVLMTISDGAISNWEYIKNRFKRIIKNKHYVHFQIGEKTQTSEDIASWDKAVAYIGDASQMPKRAIDLTKKFYKSYVARELNKR